MIIYLPLLVALVGLVLLALAVNPKAQEIGRLCFAIGLLVFLWHFGLGDHAVRVLTP